MKTASKKTAKNPATETPSSPRSLEMMARGRCGCFPITPTLIQEEPDFNYRDDYGDLESLAADIEANGLQTPLKVRKEVGSEAIYLVSGHRRMRAITQILIPAGRWPRDKDDASLPAPVECTAEKRGTRPVDRLFNQLSMNNGKPPTFLEEAKLYQRILKSDPTMKAAEIARRTGKTKQAISDSLRLVNDGSCSLLEAVRLGHLAASTALHIIKLAGADEQEQDALYAAAHQAALDAGREHIMPKDVPSDSSSSSSTGMLPAPPSSSDPSDQSDSTFQLYTITGVPLGPVPDDSPFYPETDRLALLNPPARLGITILHLLASATPHGVAYGFRINDHTHLPDVSNIKTLDTGPETGFKHALNFAIAYAIPLEASDYLHDLLYDALCRYFPEDGQPEEPETLAYVDPAELPTAKSKDSPADPGSYDRLKSAPSTNHDGSSGGPGEGYTKVEERISKLDDLMDDIDESDCVESYYQTTELLIDFLKGKHTIAKIRQHLLHDTKA